MSDRRADAASTLRELRIELEYRRSELAALERAHDVLERQLEEHADRCDRYHSDKPCAGELYSRFCRICGLVVKRCQEHGGIRAASYSADHHRAEAHGGQHARLAETDDAGRLRSGSAAVSMGAFRHHLLLEVAQSKGSGNTTPAGKPRDLRPTSVRMNRPNRGRAILGRRPGLESSAAHLVVRRLIDDAAEQLANMMHTCSIDVVDS